MAYQWSPDLATGNAMIDTQHKQLIQAINDLLDACNAGKGRTAIDGTLEFLQSYTAKHFGDEEKLQQQYRYPDYLNHKKLHDGFVAVVADLSRQLQAEGATITLVGKVNANIGNWLLNHIKKEDVKVVAHIKNAK